MENREKITAASALGSALGITAAVTGIYALSKRYNPDLKLKNLTYNEKDILLIGAGSVLGGLAGGLAADKKKENRLPKLKEASMQFFGSLLVPISFIAAGNKLLDKSGFKIPPLKGASKAVSAANHILSALPKTAVTIGALVLGMHTGNKIMNAVHSRIFHSEEKRKVHSSDYLVHADDLCTAASLVLKDSKSVSAAVSGLLPLSFIPAGTKTGSKQA